MKAEQLFLLMLRLSVSFEDGLCFKDMFFHSRKTVINQKQRYINIYK